MNAVELELIAPDSAEPLTVWATKGVSGPVVAYAVIAPEQAAHEGFTRIAFGDFSWVEQETPLALHLRGRGWIARFADDGPVYRLIVDLRQEIKRSQYIIANR